VAAEDKIEQPPQRPGREAANNIVWTATTALMLIICAAGLFVAGFFTQDLLNDDGSETQVVRQLATATPPPQPTAQATPTVLPIIEVSTDGAPTWGPDDAQVTILEFTDYQ
jgi:hypothetical protein